MPNGLQIFSHIWPAMINGIIGNVGVETSASNRALWRTVTDKLIVDFSKWETKAFDDQFKTLMRGLKINYEPKKDE